MVNLIINNKTISMDDVVDIRAQNEATFNRVNNNLARVIDVYNALNANVHNAINDLRELQNNIGTRDEEALSDDRDKAEHDNVIRTVYQRIFDLQQNFRFGNGCMVIPTWNSANKENDHTVVIRSDNQTWGSSIRVATFDNVKVQYYDATVKFDIGLNAQVQTVAFPASTLSQTNEQVSSIIDGNVVKLETISSYIKMNVEKGINGQKLLDNYANTVFDL